MDNRLSRLCVLIQILSDVNEGLKTNLMGFQISYFTSRVLKWRCRKRGSERVKARSIASGTSRRSTSRQITSLRHCSATILCTFEMDWRKKVEWNNKAKTTKAKFLANCRLRGALQDEARVVKSRVSDKVQPQYFVYLKWTGGKRLNETTRQKLRRQKSWLIVESMQRHIVTIHTPDFRQLWTFSWKASRAKNCLKHELTRPRLLHNKAKSAFV